MNTARKQAMAIFAALVKHAQDEEMPYTPQNLQKFLEHLKSRPSREVAPGPEGGRAFMYDKPIKLNFPTAKAKQRFLRRGKAPQTMKTTEKKSAWVKRAQDDDEYPELSGNAGPRGVGQRFFEGGMRGAGTGLGLGALTGALVGGYRGHNMSKGSDVATKLKAILANMLAGAAVGAGVGTAAGGAVGASGGAAFGSRKQQPTF